MQKNTLSPPASGRKRAPHSPLAAERRGLTWEDKHLEQLKQTEGRKPGNERPGATSNSKETQEKTAIARSPILKAASFRSSQDGSSDQVPEVSGSPPRAQSSPALQPKDLMHFRQQSISPTTHVAFTALEREVPHLSLAEMREIYPERDRILEEVMVTLGKDGLWRKRRVLLTRDVLLFLCGDLDICLDSVPVSEIGQVVLAQEHDYDGEKGFRILTVAGGFNGGDSFSCRAPTEASCKSWVTTLQDLPRASESRTLGWHALRRRCRGVVESDAFRWFIVITISLNFVLIITEAQLVPGAGTRNKEVFKWIDVSFTLAFALELCFSLVAYLPFEFWRDGWNICDFVIVILSLVQIIVTDLLEVQQLRLLRLFRVLRVLRLFGKLEHLRHIVSSITKAIVPVFYAMFIVLMVVSIYATVGVEIFRERSSEFENFFRAVKVPPLCVPSRIKLLYLDVARCG